MPFVEGIRLDKYLLSDSPESKDLRVVNNTLNNFITAHRRGIIFGDRWVTNTIILPTMETVELDYDIELVGEQRVSATFELSQVLYHLVHFANGNRLNILEHISSFFMNQSETLEDYDFPSLVKFLQGHTVFFWGKWAKEGKTYEGIIPPTIEVTALIDSLRNIMERKVSIAA